MGNVRGDLLKVTFQLLHGNMEITPSHTAYSTVKRIYAFVTTKESAVSGVSKSHFLKKIVNLFRSQHRFTETLVEAGRT